MDNLDAQIHKYSKFEFGKLKNDYSNKLLWETMFVSAIAEIILCYSIKFVSGGWQIFLLYLCLFFAIGIGYFLMPLIVRILLPIIINAIKIVFAVPEIAKLIIMVVLVSAIEYLETKLPTQR